MAGVEERKGQPAVDNEESKGFTRTEYSLFTSINNSAMDGVRNYGAQNPPDSDDDAQSKVLQFHIDISSQLLYKIKAQKKQLLKSAAKDKARRDKHISMMQTMEQHHLDIAREEELARIQADIKRVEEEDYMAALAQSSKLHRQ